MREGSADNAQFRINVNRLEINSRLDSDPQATDSIRVRGADGGGLAFEKQFTITGLGLLALFPV